MTMEDIWVTPAVSEALRELEATAPRQAAAVSAAINDITVGPHQEIDFPGLPPRESFFVEEPRDSAAPVVIYRRAATNEHGAWLVVSLVDRDTYRAARRARYTLAAAPPAVRDFVNTVVEGTVASVGVVAPPARVTTTQPTGGAVPTTDPASPRTEEQ